MAFGFFDWLRVNTRDAILEGASEAGQVLEQGGDAARDRTESVVQLDLRVRAVMSESAPAREATPAPALAAPTAESAPEAKPKPKADRSGPAKAVPPPPGDRRTPQRSAKTEAMFDARPGTNPRQ